MFTQTAWHRGLGLTRGSGATRLVIGQPVHCIDVHECNHIRY